MKIRAHPNTFRGPKDTLDLKDWFYMLEEEGVGKKPLK